MGIINGLLTGGVIIGKICQALGGGLGSKSYVDDATGATVVGDFSSGGVRFFRSNAGGAPGVYAFNTDTDSAVTVVVPNESNNSGVTYFIPPTQKVLFAEADSPQVSPETNVTTGPTDGTDSAQGLQGGGSLVKLAFSGLRVGGTVNVGSFRLRCNTTQLLIITSGISLIGLSYMWFNSNKGVSVSSQNVIPPNTSATGASSGETEFAFDIDFDELGFDVENDILEGQVTLQTPASAEDLFKLSKAPSQPLHPIEQEFFARLERGEL